MVLFTNLDERHQPVVNLLQLGAVFLVGVLQVLERAGGVDVVARIDAHLLAILRSHVGHAGVEVHVGHERCHDALGLQCGRDVAHVLSLARALRGQSDEFATSLDDALGLRHAGSGVVGVGGCHRLYADGVVAADADRPHVGHAANSSCSHTSLQLNRGWPSRFSDRAWPCSRPDAWPRLRRRGRASRWPEWQRSWRR